MNEEMMMNENVETTEVVEMETGNNETEESGGGLIKLAVLGGVAVGAVGVHLYNKTKDKRAKKREAKQIKKLEAAGYIVIPKEETTDEPFEVCEEEVESDEN